MVTIYLDVDDTILDSAERFVELLKENEGVDLSVDEYRAGIGKYRVAEYDKKVTFLHSGAPFFDGVRIKKGFQEFYEEFKDRARLVFVTYTQPGMEELKEKYLRFMFPEASVICMGFHGNFDKSWIVKNPHSIIIDDKIECIKEVCSRVKVLLVNRPEPSEEVINSDIYLVRNWEEIGQIVRFVIDNE